ncbi:hypothetical protein SA3096_05120 [Aggregatibacter actinomycetemcomitans serotype e str. SA3096]|nr:hypothetical protein SA3096_05120 [Aggregatibacter actinomycetemcomitans serotype e str. SA3096]
MERLLMNKSAVVFCSVFLSRPQAGERQAKSAFST